jgi:hypothetical protein
MSDQELVFHMPFCKLYEKRCIKKECPAYSEYMPITEEERRKAWSADIPLFDHWRKTHYCRRYREELIVEVEMVHGKP